MRIRVRKMLSQPVAVGVAFGVSLAAVPAARAGGYPAAEAAAASDVPCVHVVQPGDTLQSLASRYFGSEDRWRELLALNPNVADAGDLSGTPTVALRSCPTDSSSAALPSADAAAVPAAPAAAAATDSGVGFTMDLPEQEQVYFVTQSQYTYISPRRARPIAKIIGSENRLAFFGQTSTLYVSAGRDAELREGDRFTVYRDSEVVAHPITGAPLGYLTRILGDIVIERVDAESSIARVERGADTINPGDPIRPYVEVPLGVRPVANEAEMNALLLGTSGQPQDLVENRSFFIDKGEADGVKVGNRVRVYRPGAYVENPDTKRPLAQPDELVGSAIVFRVEEATSSVWVFNSRRNLRAGDRVAFELK